MEWFPSKFLTLEKPSNPYALIILNQALNWNAFRVIAKNASLIICADGGANRLHQANSASGFSHVSLPDAIIGDLDSLDEEVGRFYRQRGVTLERDPDQYSTDFTKCLKWLRLNGAHVHGSDGRLDVVAIGGLGGRVDQGFSQIHHLYKAIREKELLNGEIYLLSEQSLSFVLEEGTNRIEINREVAAQNVGIIPVTGPAMITTKGLKWDVQEWRTEFGGELSTSNHLISHTVDIETTKRVLFTMELAPHFTLAG